MNKLVLLTFLIAFTTVASGQKKRDLVVEGSLYCHVADTLVSFIQAYDSSNIVISADPFILKRIPGKYNGKEIAKTQKVKPLNRFEDYLWIRIDQFVLDMNRVFVFAKVQQQDDKLFRNWTESCTNFKLTYQCDYKANTYELVEFKWGTSHSK
ncbi:hypothetical protein [Mangrovibacterium sp.]|uniref:hypothetical protein n=1 Tax=Mangrovibacterium sp. TaxID=1961364 RepID=UPI003563EF68